MNIAENERTEDVGGMLVKYLIYRIERMSKRCFVISVRKLPKGPDAQFHQILTGRKEHEYYNKHKNKLYDN